MKIKSIAYCLTILVFLILQSCKEKGSTSNNEDARPNIIFIMSDDHAYQAISAYDQRLIKTPNIDRLADNGMLFTNASVTNSICAPSRATILTGKHTHIHGKVDNRFPFDTTNVTFPQLLQKAGYQTAMFGKLHFGNNPKGFDEFMILPGQGSYYNPDFITDKGDTNIIGYTTDIITDLTLDWLNNKREKDSPFLLMYLHKAPHRPWLPAPRHYKEFTKKTFPEPKSLFDDYKNRGTAAKSAEMNLLKHMYYSYDSKIYPKTVDQLNITEKDHLGESYFNNFYSRFTPAQRASWDSIYQPISEKFTKEYKKMSDRELMQWRYQRYMQDYLGCIAAVDENIGRLLNYLEEENLDENTIIVYTSDQGFYLGEHGWYDKRFVYDESFKTPLLIQWKDKVNPKSVNHKMVQNLDFAQTFLDIAGVEAPKDMQGKSLVPLLVGKSEEWDRDAVYYHYYEYPAEHMVKRHYAIVTEEFKLIHFYYDIDEWELYDRKKDPHEMHNVYNDSEYQHIVDSLKQELRKLRIHYKDSEELDEFYINR